MGGGIPTLIPPPLFMIKQEIEFKIIEKRQRQGLRLFRDADARLVKRSHNAVALLHVRYFNFS